MAGRPIKGPGARDRGFADVWQRAQRWRNRAVVDQVLGNSKLKQLHSRKRICQIDVLPQLSREIDNDVQTFGRTHPHHPSRYRRGQQTALGPDLCERITGAQCQVVGAEVGRVQYAQPIFAVADVEVGLVNAVDQELVASHTQRVKYVRDLVIRVELAVGDRQGYIEGAGGQCRRIVGVIDDV